MVVFINGAFGVGKTTVGKALRRSLVDSSLFDPEMIGYVLCRPPRWIPLAGRGTDDYQDLPIWRAATVQGIRLFRLRRSNVVVPQAFSDLDHFNAIREGVARFDPDVRTYCLVAPLDVVKRRLVGRGVDPASPDSQWVLRRAAECCDAHRRKEFGEPIPTSDRLVEDIVNDLMSRLQPAAQ